MESWCSERGLGGNAPRSIDGAAVPRQARLEVPLHVRPFHGQNAVDDRVTDAAVAARVMVANHAVLLGTKCGDGTLTGEIEVIGPQTHNRAAEALEGVAQQEELARRVHMAPLPAGRVPRVADLHAIDCRDNIVVPGTPDERPRAQFTHDPWEHVAVPLAREGVGNIGRRLVRTRDGGEPELPEPTVGSRSREAVPMPGLQRLEPNALVLESNWSRCDHRHLYTRRVESDALPPGRPAFPPPGRPAQPPVPPSFFSAGS